MVLSTKEIETYLQGADVKVKKKKRRQQQQK